MKGKSKQKKEKKKPKRQKGVKSNNLFNPVQPRLVGNASL